MDLYGSLFSPQDLVLSLAEFLHLIPKQQWHLKVKETVWRIKKETNKQVFLGFFCCFFLGGGLFGEGLPRLAH